ncbi:thiol-disulfide oxidoreductase DCC family protein [Neorhizobium galegae]|uniref:thiol-disulfide oxidoreductase DCC family protein n=1 Tax=Neorhizobium galegae TaxID=399 RepID=UPI00351D309B
MSDSPALTIIYDGECPFCSQYVKLLKLRDAVGKVELVNARDKHPAVDIVRSAGVVLDNTMAILQGGRIYSGAECVTRLALLSTGSGIFNRFNSFIFRHPTVSRAAYPLLRSGRALALRLLGRRKMGY